MYLAALSFLALVVFIIRKRVVLVTGGVASGKSAFCTFLCEHLNHLSSLTMNLNADTVSHSILSDKTSSAYSRVVATFGSSILDSSGVIDRMALGRIVFASKESRLQLERILHPSIGRQIACLVCRYIFFLRARVVLEMPLLYEKVPWVRHFSSCVIAVETTSETQLKREMTRERERQTTEEFRKVPDSELKDQMSNRIKAQATNNNRRKIVAIVVENNTTIDDLKMKAGIIAKQIVSKSWATM